MSAPLSPSPSSELERRTREVVVLDAEEEYQWHEEEEEDELLNEGRKEGGESGTFGRSGRRKIARDVRATSLYDFGRSPELLRAHVRKLRSGRGIRAGRASFGSTSSPSTLNPSGEDLLKLFLKHAVAKLESPALFAARRGKTQTQAAHSQQQASNHGADGVGFSMNDSLEDKEITPPQSPLVHAGFQEKWGFHVAAPQGSQQAGSSDRDFASPSSSATGEDVLLVGPAKAEFWLALALREVYARLPIFADLALLERRLPTRLQRLVLEKAVEYFSAGGSEAEKTTTTTADGVNISLDPVLAQRRYAVQMQMRWRLRQQFQRTSHGPAPDPSADHDVGLEVDASEERDAVRGVCDDLGAWLRGPECVIAPCQSGTRACSIGSQSMDLVAVEFQFAAASDVCEWYLFAGEFQQAADSARFLVSALEHTETHAAAETQSRVSQRVDKARIVGIAEACVAVLGGSAKSDSAPKIFSPGVQPDESQLRDCFRSLLHAVRADSVGRAHSAARSFAALLWGFPKTLVSAGQASGVESCHATLQQLTEDEQLISLCDSALWRSCYRLVRETLQALLLTTDPHGIFNRATAFGVCGALLKTVSVGVEDEGQLQDVELLPSPVPAALPRDGIARAVLRAHCQLSSSELDMLAAGPDASIPGSSNWWWHVALRMRFSSSPTQELYVALQGLEAAGQAFTAPPDDECLFYVTAGLVSAGDWVSLDDFLQRCGKTAPQTTAAFLGEFGSALARFSAASSAVQTVDPSLTIHAQVESARESAPELRDAFELLVAFLLALNAASEARAAVLRRFFVRYMRSTDDIVGPFLCLAAGAQAHLRQNLVRPTGMPIRRNRPLDPVYDAVLDPRRFPQHEVIARLCGNLFFEGSPMFSSRVPEQCNGLRRQLALLSVDVIGAHRPGVVGEENRAPWDLTLGDALFELQRWDAALRAYLEFASVESRSFTEPLPSNTLFFTVTRRTICCLVARRAFAQAAAVSQLLPGTGAAEATEWAMGHAGDLDPAYFECFFEIPVLEQLISHYARQGDVEKQALLARVIQTSQLHSAEERPPFTARVMLRVLEMLQLQFK